MGVRARSVMEVLVATALAAARRPVNVPI